MAQRKNTFVLLLLGCAFLAVGVWHAVLIVVTLVRARSMLSWREVPAQVLFCDIEVDSDSEGTSYRVVAEYAYTVDGARHTGTRVSQRSGSDNIGDYHHRMHSALSASLRANRPTSCWVNPRNSGDAVLDRRVRPELLALDHLACLAFGGIGLAAVLFGFSSRLWRRAESRETGGAIRMRGEATHWIVGAVACVWNAYAAWMLDTLWQVLKPEPVPWYVWSLAVVGAILLVAAVRLCWRFREYGVSTLSLTPPAVVGGPLTGTICIPARVAALKGFDLRLRCIHRCTTESGGETSTATECCWEALSAAVSGYDYGEETRVPVKFVIPCDQRATTEQEASDRYTWRLTATARTRGIGYRAVFDVPVLKGAT